MNLLQAASEAKIYTAPRIYVAPSYTLMLFVSWHWFKAFLEQTTPISSTIWKRSYSFFMRTIYKDRLKIIHQWKELKRRFRLRSCHAWFVFHYINKCNVINNIQRIIARKMSKYRVFSGPYLSVFSPNTGKYGPEKTPYMDTFHEKNWEAQFFVYQSLSIQVFSFFHRLHNSFTYLKIWLHEQNNILRLVHC